MTEQLKKPITRNNLVHLDTDLRRESLAREPGWRPMFGQSHAAQRHLQNHQVGAGDLFLFFGWFKQVETLDGRLRFKPRAPDLHVIFGWLKVGRVWSLPEDLSRLPEWAKSHPHATPDYGSNNTIYEAADTGYSAGTFPRISED